MRMILTRRQLKTLIREALGSDYPYRRGASVFVPSEHRHGTIVGAEYSDGWGDLTYTVKLDDSTRIRGLSEDDLEPLS